MGFNMKQLLTTLLLCAALSAQAQKDTTYVLISYVFPGGFGSVGAYSTTYPQKPNIVNMLRRLYKDSTMKIIVQNIVPFRSKSDFFLFFSDGAYYDTIQTHKEAPAAPPQTSTERTWYFKDLGIQPNTDQCLTDRIEQVIDSALGLGGTTSLIMSESGTYNFTNAEQTARGTAKVVIDTGCYPDSQEKFSEIVIDKCN
jgi:hypothetical protein